MSSKITINAQPRWPDVNDDYAVQFEGHSFGRGRLDGISWGWSSAIGMVMLQTQIIPSRRTRPIECPSNWTA